jgi:hypothetical protein
LLQVAASVKVSYITERELTEYLRRMKYQHGYTVIAIEQTDKSVSLADAKFPVNKASPSSEPELTNCIILLGKEKEGIPVEFLSEVDMCIDTSFVVGASAECSRVCCAGSLGSNQTKRWIPTDSTADVGRLKNIC